MAPHDPDERKIAVFIDMDNVVIGVRDSKSGTFDINLVLSRLVEKGDIVVKKAYADWNHHKNYKRPMHDAAIELIDIPESRRTGKNSADIKMVVEAMELSYTKPHIDTFALVSGDSDFSPLVSKLRENNKVVIGVGVKNSSSDLLIANCDEFIFYDDLVREKPARKRATAKKTAAKPEASAAAADVPNPSDDGKKQEALELIIETVEAMGTERGEDEKIWGSMVKQALKRRKPGFNEAYYGFRSFNKLLEEAEARHMLKLERDEKSGGYVIRQI